MRIFKVWNEDADYDEVRGHIIVAYDTITVMEMAAANACGEGSAIWETIIPETIGFYTGKETEPFIIMTDYFEA